ncbi:tRNA (adenosine(37)-N6)-dimethylallyltransferase MiaA [Candidatus Falkowbacteria bacterium RIFOXYB2_FULL_34_18]|uniref:tRNA dimethylallyltransferase n=1 Tax=Candidatus Falkowbacteria bacterium RIFOXYD2_FULL_34_120 TaxID=1798007 RepID=A0A1F5TRX5_9BACT|nr:MAG: tRNA (adenosine(37)-N6)-dimethylallyltransferase MiaA [Candidatus Falkowbacteria bacterium RIFOXYB2_FULL_34_18]OGF29729.1 MAG: tRNA (adenosine(37)-N6)-dimethylallyltransferase MiaA [Candidatus Falkowbacteria bacterium RIFOXYC12_FULL_34_55]OGF37461.1 MAG: tRNA (adenosine(37)-N6)-dimethylallyltransferase MiaA [Candidatus Falkowbacteria bacterium RIFOXYC2_FULL_34_220]OGF39187.1 MAG: tRNA (adenosine(37)-N6)-dimethylallyltransferase MiaA [Candidatus Falkowbacteria bacterium RIFOXYD12_FULL_34_
MLNNKIIVIVGTTASGKTGLAVKLAYKFNGEIISADSRQVYRYMDIGTGKDLEEYQIKSSIRGGLVPRINRNRRAEKIKIPYHLLDVVDPKTEFNLAKFQKQAYKAMDDIIKRNNLPIIAGGTGLYAQAIVDGYDLSPIKGDKKLREKLEKKDSKQLFAELKRVNSKFAAKLNESDRQNKRRLVRYIEIEKESEKLKSHPPKADQSNYNNKLLAGKSGYDYFVIGLTWPMEVLRERIYKRLIQRLDQEDMVGEVERLHGKHGVSWKRLRSFGLEYKFISMYLQKEIGYEDMVEKLNIAIGQFAKRQMTWLRRWEKQGQKIHWTKTEKDAIILVHNFLK